MERSIAFLLNVCLLYCQYIMNYYITVNTSEIRLSAHQSVLITEGTNFFLCTVIKVMDCIVPRFGKFVKIVDFSKLTFAGSAVDFGTFSAHPIELNAQKND